MSGDQSEPVMERMAAASTESLQITRRIMLSHEEQDEPDPASACNHVDVTDHTVVLWNPAATVGAGRDPLPSISWVEVADEKI